MRIQEQTRTAEEGVYAVERLLAYVDYRKTLLAGEIREFTCLAGTMVKEVYYTHPTVREACDKSISGHAETLESDIDEVYAPRKK